jgi:hypothetical protein
MIERFVDGNYCILYTFIRPNQEQLWKMQLLYTSFGIKLVLWPCDSGDNQLSYKVQLSCSNHKFMYIY